MLLTLLLGLVVGTSAVILLHLGLRSRNLDRWLISYILKPSVVGAAGVVGPCT